MDAATYAEMPYVGGAAPREVVTSRRVLTANESPPEQPIPFHHEMAQVPNPPGYVMFYCDIAPERGGATPIVHSHQVYRRFQALDPAFCEHLEEHGARYVRVMPPQDDPSSPIGRSWRSTFQSHAADEAEAREQAEAKMREIGTTWRWLESGDLYTETAPVPAIRVDERSGRATFFNSMVAAYTGWVDERNDPTQSVKCGDGSPVRGDVLLATAEAMREEQVALTWSEGDQLWIDNRLVMHSRQPFSGARRILAAIAPSS
jgi:alpha-ketoglutarate-dependent taurine dioxygenase